MEFADSRKRQVAPWATVARSVIVRSHSSCYDSVEALDPEALGVKWRATDSRCLARAWLH